MFERQRQAATEGDYSLAGAVTRLAQTRPLRAVASPLAAGGRTWTPPRREAAKAALRRSLGKDADGPVRRWLNRPLSSRLSMLLAPLRPAPDLVSLVAFTFGLAGGLLVHELGRDEVDGEVARLQLQDGPRGALLDGVLDRVGDGHPGRAWAVGAGRP